MLCRSEFEAAISADRKLVAEQAAASASAEQPVSSLSIALASSIPFIGMGAVDNAIMVSISLYRLQKRRLRFMLLVRVCVLWTSVRKAMY